jgi:hypothetical protein
MPDAGDGRQCKPKAGLAALQADIRKRSVLDAPLIVVAPATTSQSGAHFELARETAVRDAFSVLERTVRA